MYWSFPFSKDSIVQALNLLAGYYTQLEKCNIVSLVEWLDVYGSMSMGELRIKNSAKKCF